MSRPGGCVFRLGECRSGAQRRINAAYDQLHAHVNAGVLLASDLSERASFALVSPRNGELRPDDFRALSERGRPYCLRGNGVLTFGYDTSELLVIEDGAVDAAREWARRCFPKKKFRCWQDANTLSVMFEHSTKSDMEWLAKKIAPEVRTKARILPELSECVCESALLREKIVYLQEATKRDASISSPRSASGLVTRLETSMIEIHESEGRVGLTVQADTEEQFMAQFAQAAEEFLEGMAGNDERERARMLGKLLKPYNEVLCKLRGYKAIVTEHRVLSAGDFVSDNVKIVLDSDGNVRRFPVDKSDAKAAVG